MTAKKNQPPAPTPAADFLDEWTMINNATDPNSPNMTPEQLEAFEETRQAQYQLNKSILACLSTPDGQVFLDYMREVATEGARFDVVHETDAQLAAAKGFFREGQAAFYFDVVIKMREASKGPPAAQ